MPLRPEVHMARTTSLLVVANVTAASDALLQLLLERARSGPLRVTLLVPAGGAGRSGARERIDRALEPMRRAGIEAEGRIGPPDPSVAVHEIWDPRRFDEIVVSTLPTGASRWLQIDLPHRLERLTDARVTHVEMAPEEPPVPAPTPSHRSPRQRLGLLEPLSSLGWGGKLSRRG
jgi:hypothetical protein